MRIKFFGDEEDPKTKEMGIFRGAVYNAELKRGNWFTKYVMGTPILLHIQVKGDWHWIPYESMQAFDRNWRIK